MLNLFTVLDLAKEAGIRIVVDDNDKKYWFCSGRVYGEDLVNFAKVIRNYLEQNVTT